MLDELVDLLRNTIELMRLRNFRMIHAVMNCVTRFDGVIRRAMETGAVSRAAIEQPETAGPPTPEIARLQQLAEEAGGIAALELVVSGGDETHPTEEA